MLTLAARQRPAIRAPQPQPAIEFADSIAACGYSQITERATVPKYYENVILLAPAKARSIGLTRRISDWSGIVRAKARQTYGGVSYFHCRRARGWIFDTVTNGGYSNAKALGLVKASAKPYGYSSTLMQFTKLLRGTQALRQSCENAKMLPIFSCDNVQIAAKNGCVSAKRLDCIAKTNGL